MRMMSLPGNWALIMLHCIEMHTGPLSSDEGKLTSQVV